MLRPLPCYTPHQVLNFSLMYSIKTPKDGVKWIDDHKLSASPASPALPRPRYRRRSHLLGCLVATAWLAISSAPLLHLPRTPPALPCTSHAPPRAALPLRSALPHASLRPNPPRDSAPPLLCLQSCVLEAATICTQDRDPLRLRLVHTRLALRGGGAPARSHAAIHAALGSARARLLRLLVALGGSGRLDSATGRGGATGRSATA